MKELGPFSLLLSLFFLMYSSYTNILAVSFNLIERYNVNPNSVHAYVSVCGNVL